MEEQIVFGWMGEQILVNKLLIISNF